MIPPIIVEEALARGINLIAITDHNASENVASVVKAAEGTGLSVLPGVELETAEEIHLLCLFPSVEAITQFQELIDKNLPPIPNNEEYFGTQLVVNDKGEFVRKDLRLLSTATRLPLELAASEAIKLGGHIIPAHIEREENGMLSRLGTVPVELPIQILEITRFSTREKVLASHPELAGYHFIQGGDVHYITDMLGATQFEAPDCTFEAIWQALSHN
jgi:PHP family Zn ribbon phosphoesterase